MTVPASEGCDVSIVVASAGYWRPEKGWRIGRVVAFAAGCRVTYTKNYGWRCTCADLGCRHIAAVAAQVDPELLRAIRGGFRHQQLERLNGRASGPNAPGA